MAPQPLPSPWPQCRLWRVDLDAPTADEAPLRLLSAHEQARARRFAFARERWRYQRAHVALRLLLAQALAADPAALQLATQAEGKPWLPAAPDLHFNLSHSQGTAVIAIGSGAPTGVDVELPRAVPDALALAAAHASAAEQQALAALPAARRDAAFLQLWTRKEACLKALGTGLMLDARLLEVGLGQAHGAPVPQWRGPAAAQPPGRLQLASWTLADGAHLALAQHHGAPA